MTIKRLCGVKILRTRTTYQFTDRLLLRNIMEYNTFDVRYTELSPGRFTSFWED